MAKKKRTKTELELATVFDPRLYRHIEALARDALNYSSNHTVVRSTLVSLLVEMRLRALAIVGHETIDCTSLTALLDRTKALEEGALPKRPPPEHDVIRDLSTKQGFREPVLTNEQVSAAVSIRSIWLAFSRGLYVGGRFTPLGSGKPNKRYDPMQLMGEKTFSVWKDRWRPWYDAARFRSVLSKPGRHAGKIVRPSVPVFHTDIVFNIVIHNVKPRLLDRIKRLEHRTSLVVLQEELSAYNEGR